MFSSECTSDVERIKLALALLVSQKDVGAGERPDLFTLDQWRQGRLSQARHREVLSWLAQDAALQEQLVALEKAEAEFPVLDAAALGEQKTKPVQRQTMLLNWWQSLMRPQVIGGLAGAMMLLVAVLLLPQGTNPDLGESIDALYGQSAKGLSLVSWPWRVEVQSKGLDIWPGLMQKPLSQEQVAFRRGVKRGLLVLGVSGESWQQSLAYLSVHSVECDPTDQACAERRRLADLSGFWSVAAFSQACREQGAGTPQGVEQVGDRLLNQWQAVSQDPHLVGLIQEKASCERVMALLDWGLKK